MAEIISDKKGGLPIDKKKFDLDTFKSLYYWTNAKHDTQIKFFSKRRRLELSDIHQLNQRVFKKLETHEVITYIITLIFILDDKNMREYGSWDEFKRENWDLINPRVLSININWDITFKLSGHELPQRHTMKLKIGNSFTPKDMLELMFTSDEPKDLMETQASGLVKVDFINQALANELIKLAQEWYEGLSQLKPTNQFVKFIENNENNVSNILNLVLPIFCMYLFYANHDSICYNLSFIKELNMETLQRTIIIFALLFGLGNMIAIFINNWFSSKVNKIKYESGILVSKGDKNFLKEIDSNNKKIIREISIRFIIALFVGIILLFLQLLINYWVS